MNLGWYSPWLQGDHPLEELEIKNQFGYSRLTASRKGDKLFTSGEAHLEDKEVREGKILGTKVNARQMGKPQIRHIILEKETA